jgi:hypothetical protein
VKINRHSRYLRLAQTSARVLTAGAAQARKSSSCCSLNSPSSKAVLRIARVSLGDWVTTQRGSAPRRMPADLPLFRSSRRPRVSQIQLFTSCEPTIACRFDLKNGASTDTASSTYWGIVKQRGISCFIESLMGVDDCGNSDVPSVLAEKIYLFHISELLALMECMSSCQKEL